MHVTIVHVAVKSEFVDEFLAATRLNHENSVLEPGNLRFDVLQSTDDPTRFAFYEAYRSKADALAHKETEHYHTWRETVAEWMASPRLGIPYTGLYPKF